MRTLERKSYTLNEERLKRQVADVHSELEVARELNEEMRGQSVKRFFVVIYWGYLSITAGLYKHIKL